MCGSMNDAGRVRLMQCVKDEHEHCALCERYEPWTITGQNGSERRLGVELPVPSNFTVHLAHTVCPSGHWTHEFLTCDRLSPCLHQDFFRLWSERKNRRNTASPCLFPFTEMFSCMSKDDVVIYSLVCDRSQDCQDNSE